MHLQGSAEVFFRKVKFWDGGGDAPPVFTVDGVSYLHVKVRGGVGPTWEQVLEGEPRPAVARSGIPPATPYPSNCRLRVQDGGLHLVATARENVSPSLVLELLKRVGGIIRVRQPYHPPHPTDHQ